MRRTPILRGLIATILAVAVFGFFVASKTNAQTASQPQFFVTWHATESYAPIGYSGPVLPNQESQIVASVEVINNGKLADLSSQTIYWYENENLLGGGIGAQSIVFRPYGQAPNTETLRVDIPDYPGGSLIHEIEIPLIQPEVVVEAPYPGGDFSGTQANVQALPYFFDTPSSTLLGFSWTVNGQTVTSALNPQSLQISLPQSTPSGYSIAVSLAVQRGNNSIMTANGTANLTYQSQL